MSHPLNYRFLCTVYAVLTAISLVLLVLEKRFGVEQVIGFWIVPAPSVLALVVTLEQWYNARAQPVVEAAKKRT